MNITLFDNCKGHGEAEVELLSVEYACDASGVCDTVHGVYEIYESHQLLGYEVEILIYNSTIRAGVFKYQINE